jgi:hypothetical protein
MNEILPAWGFNSHRRMKALEYINYEQESVFSDLEKSNKFNGIIRKGNALKVVGYIPGLNIVIGVAIIVFARTNHSLKNYPIITRKYTFRGAAMIVGGPLLLVPDLVITAVDEIFTVRPVFDWYHSSIKSDKKVK